MKGGAHAIRARPVAAAGAVAGLMIAIALLAGVQGAAGAGTITVMNTHDSGPGSLRQAIADATTGDTVAVPSGTYTLTSGELLVEKRIRIKGAGARRTIIDGNHASRIFEIRRRATGTEISGITVQHGNPANADGGGIEVSGAQLRLARVAVKNNRVGKGHSGGGIHGSAGAHVALLRSVVSGNHASSGGGIDVTHGGFVTPNVFVTISTIARNVAGGPDSNGHGGAIEADVLEVFYSTIARNRCFGRRDCGAAIFGTEAEFGSTIVAGNRAFLPNGNPAGSRANPGRRDGCSVNSPKSDGHNLERLRDCEFTRASDIQRANPLLGKLANHGGQTNTMGLRKGSPAIDAGLPNCYIDQRGVRRPQGPRCDIGAFERKKR